LGNIRNLALVIVLVILLELPVILLYNQLFEGRYKTGNQSKEATAPLAIQTNRESTLVFV
jgi:hypothetical protein